MQRLEEMRSHLIKVRNENYTPLLHSFIVCVWMQKK